MIPEITALERRRITRRKWRLAFKRFVAWG
jgi:hypothetical protein